MEIPILKDIVIIFALSTLVNFFFTKIKLPTVLGYLLTGVITGPHLLSLISDSHDIELVAEIGVILLLFTIGMEFSLKHLLKIRKIVFLGGFIQVSLTAAAFFFSSFAYNMSWQEGLFIGFLAALSSSALVLKLLQERSELTSNYGRTVLGILIFQDLLLVPLILFANLLGKQNADPGSEILTLLLKTSLIIGFVYIANKYLVPRLLRMIAMVKNQELFLMSVLLICLAVALFTASLGMSLAFGAFLAGLMISESEYSHNAFGNLIPFKDTFTSFFFVSIGMLLDLQFIEEHLPVVILSILLVVLLKAVIGGLTGFLLGHTFRGLIMVGLALSQVGEFSFILAKIGLEFNIISGYTYNLFLAVAVITMGLSPFLIKTSPAIGEFLCRFPLPPILIRGLFPLREMEIPALDHHLVIIGKDASALKLSVMANHVQLPHISIIFDPVLVRERQKAGDTVIYGDAVNEPILRKAHADTADLIAVSVGDLIPAMAIVEKVRQINRNAFILVRTRHIQHMEQLYALGADQVLPEKLEIAIDLFNRILTRKLLPQKEVNRIISHIRSDYYGIFREKDVKNRPTILDELATLDITALQIDPQSPVVGKTLAQIKLRNVTGVTLLAIKRASQVIEHPDPAIVFVSGDIVYVMGNPEQVNKAAEMFTEGMAV